MVFVILGGSGYVGSAFRRELDRRGLGYRSLSRSELDYTDPRILEEGLRRLKPDFLINCAGYTGKPNVDACEANKESCLEGNTILPGRIASVCKDLEIGWGHVASGCIFSGRRADGGGFREADVPNFTFRSGRCSFYSGTKALGEEVLGYGVRLDNEEGPVWCADSEGGYVWRLRIPFDHRDHPRNYLTKLMRYPMLLDAENSITHLNEFARACIQCVADRVPYGLFNVTNPGSITTRRIVELILERSEELNLQGIASPFPAKYCFFEDENEFMSKAALTPRSNCILDSSKIAGYGIQMRQVEQAVRESLEQWQIK